MHDAGIFRFNNTEIHMNKYLLSTLSSSLGLLILASCSDDKPTVTPVGEKLYAQNAGLQLFYSQAPMPGKFAKFTQNGSA